MSMLSMLISMGFKNVISIDKDPKKLDIAKKIGTKFCVNSNKKNYKKRIRQLFNKDIDICLEAGDTSFPKVAPPRRHIPGWNSDVKPLRDDSIFWHQVRKDAGSPSTGALAGVMRSTRAKYHKCVKEHN